MKVFLAILLSSLVSLQMVRWVYFKILRIAKDKNLVDNPNARKLQSNPVPVLGGMAVFAGVVAGLMMGAVMHTLQGDPTTTRLLPITCAMVIMLYVGWMDDVVGVSPLHRMFIEVITILGMIYATNGCIDTFHNMFGINEFSWYIGVPLTVFAGVGIINSINMIDGVNGLSSGLCMACSTMFGVAFVWVGDTPNAVLAFCMAASLIPFILHNVFGMRSKMFIGDAGTMVMGILMTWFVVNMLRSDSPMQYYVTTQGVNMIALALAIMSVPVADTLRVMTMRILNGKNPLEADKTHLHHMFIKAGVSHAVTALTEIFIDCLIVGIWAISVYAHIGLEWQLFVVILAAMLLVWGTYVIFRYNELRHTKFMHKLAHFSVYTHFGQKSWWLWLQKFLDRRETVNAEESSHRLEEHLMMRFEHSDPAVHDALQYDRLMAYLRGRTEVHVRDISYYGRIDEAILSELIQKGIDADEITVIEKDEDGNPLILAAK